MIGLGPIVIGQACEFDYAGCQALKVLREDGYRTIVVNSNPATIMTDPGFADRTYIEPLDLESVASVLERSESHAPADARRPDRLEPRDRARPGGRPRGAGSRADRRARRGDPPRRGSSSSDAVRSCGLEVPTSRVVTSLAEVGRRLPARSGTPGVHPGRPRRRLRRGPATLRRQVERGLSEPPIAQVLVEESARADEFDELMRDRKDNVVVVCSIENLDLMGVHMATRSPSPRR